MDMFDCRVWTFSAITSDPNVLEPAADRSPGVVGPLHIGAWVVHAGGVLPLRGAPRARETVARRGQRLTQPLPGRVEAFVPNHDTVPRRPSSDPETTSQPDTHRL